MCFRFNPKTYRAIGRRLAASRTPRYLISYANPNELIEYNYSNLVLLHKEKISMVAEAGRNESKTAYFYKIDKVVDGNQTNIPCASYFQDCYDGSKADEGERYQLLMNQRLLYQQKFGNVVTRNRTKTDSLGYFIEASDEETIS